jgi:hypothetical protein
MLKSLLLMIWQKERHFECDEYLEREGGPFPRVGQTTFIIHNRDKDYNIMNSSFILYETNIILLLDNGLASIFLGSEKLRKNLSRSITDINIID